MDRLEGDTNNMGKGAAIGGTLGGLAAALPALGVLAIPGIGPILAAGPIAVIFGGVVAGGVAGGLIGALTEMGVSSVNAKDYEYQLDQGKIIVLVDNIDNMYDEVYSIYNQNNSLTNKNVTKY
jgi:outer membrane lipoprotein SlyB